MQETVTVAQCKSASNEEQLTVAGQQSRGSEERTHIVLIESSAEAQENMRSKDAITLPRHKIVLPHTRKNGPMQHRRIMPHRNYYSATFRRRKNGVQRMRIQTLVGIVTLIGFLFASW